MKTFVHYLLVAVTSTELVAAIFVGVSISRSSASARSAAVEASNLSFATASNSSLQQELNNSRVRSNVILGNRGNIGDVSLLGSLWRRLWKSRGSTAGGGNVEDATQKEALSAAVLASSTAQKQTLRTLQTESSLRAVSEAKVASARRSDVNYHKGRKSRNTNGKQVQRWNIFKFDRHHNKASSSRLYEHIFRDSSGKTCFSCIESGGSWCGGETPSGIGNGGVCVDASTSMTSFGHSDAQCFIVKNDCPTIRVPASAQQAPMNVMISSTQSDGRPEWDNNPLVDVKHKLIFCEIPKVACSDFKRLFRRLGGAKDFDSQEPWIHDPKQNGILRLTDMPPGKAREVMKDPTWTKAIFVRDPLERLLSGYLDKCRPVKERYDIHCPFEGEVSFDTFARYVFKQADMVPNGKNAMDEHWRPQHLVCDLQRWLPYYQFQGNFSHLRAHTKFLLEDLGLFDDFGRGWGASDAAAGAAAAAAAAAERTGHDVAVARTPGGGTDAGVAKSNLDIFESTADWHQTSTGDHVNKHYSKELADVALEFYKVDYEIFLLPVPVWYHELK